MNVNTDVWCNCRHGQKQARNSADIAPRRAREKDALEAGETDTVHQAHALCALAAVENVAIAVCKQMQGGADVSAVADNLWDMNVGLEIGLEVPETHHRTITHHHTKNAART